MSTVPGDPASLSSCAAAAAAAGRSLTARADALAPALADLGDGWPGRASVGFRRRGDALTAATTTTAAELERVARVLQDQATDLAGLVADARGIDERASAAGLEVRDGRVLPAYGVLGSADAAADLARTAAATALQAELDLVLARHRRRRDFVLGVLRESTATLAETSHGLRRGAGTFSR